MAQSTWRFSFACKMDLLQKCVRSTKVQKDPAQLRHMLLNSITFPCPCFESLAGGHMFILPFTKAAKIARS